MEIKETNIIIDNTKELPDYLNEIFNRLDKLEQEIKELKHE